MERERRDEATVVLAVVVEVVVEVVVAVVAEVVVAVLEMIVTPLTLRASMEAIFELEEGVAATCYCP